MSQEAPEAYLHDVSAEPVAHESVAPLSIDQRLHIGASWYPEMWPQDQWAGDIEKMAELGFTIVRVFEFAWHRFEPEEGRFDFDWALQLLDLLHARGIAAMPGTPTAAPPAWLTTRYPDVLQTGADGRRASHGQRKHFSHVSRQYRELCARIVAKMAAQFGGHPAVAAWQIDNEMSGSDFGEETRYAFHAWLRHRYGSIDALNEAWGLEFWSQAYSDFSQIPMPTSRVGSIEVPERHHPSLIMAIARFNNEQWTQYIANQCSQIRKADAQRSDDTPARPITTNMVGTMAMDWYSHNTLMQRVGASMYKDVDHYHWNLPTFDRMRAEKQYAPYWLLETAPNWSGGGRVWNIHHNARGMQAFAWMSTVLGGQMVLFWQWRQHWAGQEMQHGTHVTATGQWRPNREAWTQLASQFREHEQWLVEHPPARAAVALMMDSEAAWAFSIDPIGDDMSYPERFRDDYHLPLADAHIWRDVIAPDADLSPYRVLLMPMLPIVSKPLRARLEQWVQQGGRLLLGPLTGYRTDEFTCFTDDVFGGLETLIGAGSCSTFTPMWVEDRYQVAFDPSEAVGDLEQPVGCRTWCEAFEPTSGRVMATYQCPDRHGLAEGYGHGLPAIIDHRFGRGRVITVGTRVDASCWVSLVRTLCEDAGAAFSPAATGSPRVVVAPRRRRDAQGRAPVSQADAQADGYGLVNLAESPQSIALPCSGVDRLSGRAVGPTIDLAPLEVMLVDVAGS